VRCRPQWIVASGAQSCAQSIALTGAQACRPMTDATAAAAEQRRCPEGCSGAAWVLAVLHGYSREGQAAEPTAR
jgi:hypothetical protein